MPTLRSVAATASPPMPAPMMAIDGFFLAISAQTSVMRPNDRTRGASRARWRTVSTLSACDALGRPAPTPMLIAALNRRLARAGAAEAQQHAVAGTALTL